MPVESNPARARPCLRIELLLFLLLWSAYGLTINSGNLTAFGLQQAGVEAYVERHHLYLEGSQVELLQVQPVVDAFTYNGHIYPAKQPGQFMAGAVAYAPLHLLGFSYSKQYLVTAALVTFLTASLLVAISGLAVFRCVLLLQNSRELFWPITVTLIYAFATTAFPYSGIPWHDSLSMSYLVLSFYFLLEGERTKNERRQRGFILAGGVLLGLTITTSMLPFTMVLVLSGDYVYSQFRFDRSHSHDSSSAEARSGGHVNRPAWLGLLFFFVGVGLGLLPLLTYNSICFGNPLLLPNVAGGYRDTFFYFSAQNFLEKLEFYARMVTLYVPVFWAGIVGLAFFPRALRREQWLIALLLFASFVYIVNIDATGTCQYGPRYLLPAMPFACLGLIGFRFAPRGRRRAAVLLMVIIGAGSFAINLIGAVQGAMLCDFPHFAAGLYISQILRGDTRVYPLARWIIVPFIMWIILLTWCGAQCKREKYS